MKRQSKVRRSKITGFSMKIFVILLGVYSTSAFAVDMLYWINCTNCDVTMEQEAELEIIQTAGPHANYDANHGGGSPGFEPGDQVIVQKYPGLSPIAQWERNTFFDWEINNEAFICSGPGRSFAHCLDLTIGHVLPKPPWVAPVPAQPSTPSASVEWEYCVGSSAVYAVDWWAASGDTVDTFVVENKTGSASWLPIYDGAGTHCSLSTPYPTQFRVKAINSAGESGWSIVWGNHNCSWGGDPD